MKRPARALGFAVFAFAAAIAVSAQLAFEVASITPNKSEETGGSLGVRPGGSIIGRNIPARALIVFAYQLKSYQVVGLPGWAQTDRYDLEAKANGPATPDQLREMMRSLLAERFKLRTHLERRELDGYRRPLRRGAQVAPDLEPSDLPSIFTAVQEQWGLKLVSEKIPSEVLVVDTIDRPTEN